MNMGEPVLHPMHLDFKEKSYMYVNENTSDQSRILVADLS